jgi:hypothetical protein
MGWSSRLKRLEELRARADRDRLEAMSDEELGEHIAGMETRLRVPPGPDVRAMSDAELSAYAHYLRGGGDAHDWRWDGATV